MGGQGLFDSDILIDYLQGVAAAREEVARYQDPCISIVSWIEVMSRLRDDDEDRAVRAFLRRFRLIFVDIAIAELAADLRRRRRLKLPDATIWATAQSLGCPLVTRNTSDFPATAPGIHVPYRL